MKACSFLPAATQMIYDMGLQDLLYGVTFECPSEAAGKPVIVRCMLEGKDYRGGSSLFENVMTPASNLMSALSGTEAMPPFLGSTEIDRIFSASKAQGKSLYYVEEELLQAIAPDIIFTQDVCDVCQIDTVCTTAAVAKLQKQPDLIPLTPGNLEQVFQTAVTIAAALGREEAAYHYLATLKRRIDRIIDELRKNRAPLKRVLLMEWIEPIYNCGHWIPYQIACAGGIDMLSNPGGDSIVTQWDKIRKYNPEVLVIAPCGFTISRAQEELHLLRDKPGWDQLQAVQQGAVFAADFDMFTQPSPGTLTDGIELLAALFHPDIFSVPEKLQHKYCKISESSFQYV